MMEIMIYIGTYLLAGLVNAYLITITFDLFK